MGKFVNQNGKIRVMILNRAGMELFVTRKGKGVFVSVTLQGAINKAREGITTQIRENYELVNRIVKNNPILKLRDAQPDGLLIAQHPIQQKLPL